MPKSEKRFARQHIYEPPPGFLLASPCSGIVHHLSVTIGVASADQWPACIETLDVSSPGRVHLLDSQRRWTPWSVFQDGWRAARPEGSPGRGARRGSELQPLRAPPPGVPERTRAPFHGNDFIYFALSLQSSFQLSLTVLVLYRPRARV